MSSFLSITCPLHGRQQSRPHGATLALYHGEEGLLLGETDLRCRVPGRVGDMPDQGMGAGVDQWDACVQCNRG